MFSFVAIVNEVQMIVFIPVEYVATVLLPLVMNNLIYLLDNIYFNMHTLAILYYISCIRFYLRTTSRVGVFLIEPIFSSYVNLSNLVRM